jgi:hypothetical protein
MDGKDVHEKRIRPNRRGNSQYQERFMWSNVCKKSKQSPQQDEKQPLSKLFVSGSINGEEKSPRRLSDLTPTHLQENVNQSNSQDNRTSPTEKLTTYSPQSFSPDRPLDVASIITEPLRQQLALKEVTEKNSTEKSLGCWTFNPRKRKRFPCLSTIHLNEWTSFRIYLSLTGKKLTGSAAMKQAREDHFNMGHPSRIARTGLREVSNTLPDIFSLTQLLGSLS